MATVEIDKYRHLLSDKVTNVDSSQQYVYNSSAGGRDHLNGMRVRLA